MKKIRLNHYAIILLAAGRSGRLGTPKQMLLYEGKTLLRRSVEAAIGTGTQSVVVVLGAHHSLMEKELEQVKGIRVILNKKWEEGIASSIRLGVETALKMDKELDGLVIMVCDQPFVSSELLQSLFQKHQETGMHIVASSYGEDQGVPALFDKTFFNRLLLLKGDSGAKKLWKDQVVQVALVPFQHGAADIDTMEEYFKLKETEKEKND